MTEPLRLSHFREYARAVSALLGPRENFVVLGSADGEPAPAEVMLFVRRLENGR